MARNDFKQRVIFELEDRASRNLGRVRSAFGSLGSFLASRFTITLGDIAGLFRSLAGAATSVVSAAQAQENAVRSLDDALAGAGARSDEYSRALQDQAAALEATTKFSDEAIIAGQALSLNLGASADQVEKLTEAAVELSASTGTSLESSFVNLTRTLNGFRGELGELVPEVASLTEEQLKSGAALEAILSRLGGTAASQVGTFSGIIAQLGNAWGTVQERLGAVISENEAVRKSLEKLRDVISSERFLGSLESVVANVGDLSAKLVDLAAVIPDVTQKIRDFFAGVAELNNRINAAIPGIASLIERFNEFRKALLLAPLKAASDAILELGSASTAAATETEKLAEQTERDERARRRRSPTLQSDIDALRGISETSAEAASTTGALASATVDAAASAERYAANAVTLEAQIEALGGSFARATSQARELNAETGGVLSGLKARDPRNQADVDAALAAGRRPTNGGTRLRTADGSGSRLLAR